MIAPFNDRPALRRALIWAVPIVPLLLILGIELYRGNAPGDVVPAAATRPPTPVNVAVLPLYAIGTGDDALSAIGEHTLFNPTRRPAPPALATEDGPSRIPKGLYLLTGTTVYGGSAVAYLKNTKDGKQHTVRKGDKLDGIQVTEVTATSVRLAAGGDSESLELKVAAGPRTTLQPAPVTLPGGAPEIDSRGGGAAAAANAPVPAAQPANRVYTPRQPENLAERRRAARAAARGNPGAGSNFIAPARPAPN